MKKIANTCTTISELYSKVPYQAITAMKVNGFYDEIVSKLISDKRLPGYWNDKERCREEATKYTTRSEFQKFNSAAYKASKRHGWLDKFIQLNSVPAVTKWSDKERCREASSKYTTRGEFQKLNGGAYTAARRYGWLDEFIPVIPIVRISKWSDKEKCKEASSKYATRSAFERLNSGAYKASKRYGWLDEFFPRKVSGERTCTNSKWSDKEKCREASAKYATRSEFQEFNSGAYKSAKKHGWIDEFIPGNLIIKMTQWNDKGKCHKRALEFTSFSRFKDKSKYAYAVAVENGWLNEICSHMSNSITKSI